jgi:hypothetical protein
MGDFKKLLWAFPIGIVISLYTTFIIQNLWNWFVVPAFHVAEISFWGIFGLVLLVNLLAEGQKSGDKFATEQRWKNIGHVLDACIPPEKMESVRELVEAENEGMWLNLGIEAFGKIVGNTLTLLVGWVVHMFLV